MGMGSCMLLDAFLAPKLLGDFSIEVEWSWVNGAPTPAQGSFGWSGLLYHACLSLQCDPTGTETVEPLQQRAEDPGDGPQSPGRVGGVGRILNQLPAPDRILSLPISPKFSSKGTGS